MKKFKLFAGLLAMVVAVAASFAFVGCSDVPEGDTHPADNSFEGKISAESYASTDAAAAAFLEEEINGASTEVTFVSYTKEGDLTEEEIAQLKLGEIAVADVQAAEKGNIAYTENGAGVLASAGEKTVRAYMIRVGDRYFYYVPIFKRGELITKSYISDILDYSKYLNVTETSVTKATTSAGGMSMTVTTTSVAKISSDRVYAKISIAMPAMSGEENQVTETIILPSESGLKIFIKYNNRSWEQSGTAEYSSIEEFIEEMFKFDHTYFVKTSSGFKLSNEKLMTYLDDVMSEFASMGTVKSGSAEYYVKDGKLDSASVKISMTTQSQGMSVNVNVNGSTTYTDYGTTTIDIPAEVQSMLTPAA